MRRPALLVACLMLSACVYIPTKHKVVQGTAITPEQASFLYDAGMTLAQARERLGPPTLDLRDIKVALWSWLNREGGVIVLVPVPMTPLMFAGDDDRYYTLMVAYSDDGRVLTHLLEKRSVFDTASEQARDWHRRIRHTLPQAAAFAGATLTRAAYGTIHVYMPERSCAYGTVDIHLDGERVAELGFKDAIVTQASPSQHELTARVGELAFGMPLQVTVDASQPVYVRVCSPGLMFQPWKLIPARSSGVLGGADVLRIVDAKTAAAEMPPLP